MSYQRFKKLFNTFDVSCHGIKLNRVLALRIWWESNDCPQFSIKDFAFLFVGINMNKLGNNPNRKEILATYGRNKRKDHIELYENIMGVLGDDIVSCYTMDFNYSVCFHPKLVFSIWKQCFRTLKNTGLDIKQKLSLTLPAIMYGNTILNLEKVNFSSYKKYLCMCHCLDLENLLTQYFNNFGINTYSLMEGVYHVYKKMIPDGVIAYDNFETKNLLCWGEYSKKELVSVGISPNNIVVAGYPKKVSIQKLKENNPFYTCVVLLGSGAYLETNKRLLNILSRCKYYNYKLKPHPATYNYYKNNVKDYEIINKNVTVNDCLDNSIVDFCIAVNTSAYYEAYMRGVPCLRFYDDSFDLLYGCNDVFTNMEEFESLVNKIKEKPLLEYQKEVDEMLKVSVGIGINKYKEIIEKTI